MGTSVCERLKHVHTGAAWISFMALSMATLASASLLVNISCVPDHLLRPWLIEVKWIIGLPSRALVIGAFSYLVVKNLQNVMRNDSATSTIALSISSTGAIFLFWMFHTVRHRTLAVL